MSKLSSEQKLLLSGFSGKQVMELSEEAMQQTVGGNAGALGQPLSACPMEEPPVDDGCSGPYCP